MTISKDLSNIRFAVLGKIIHTDFFIKSIAELGFPKPLVIVSLDEEYYRDERLLAPHGLYSDIEKLADKGLCNLYKLKSVNSEEAFKLFDKFNCNLAFSINCRNIIKRDVINYFSGNIFNLHDSFLPNERGGALNSWRILNGINQVGNTIHFLEEGIDTGPIIVQRKVEIEDPYPMSLDYLKAEKDNCEVILSKFIDMLITEKPIEASDQENDKSFYFPRLFTEENGLINWDWDVEMIERFIRAFSLPYPGAYSYYCDKKVHIVKAIIDDSKNEFHPFANGKVVTIMDNQDVRVIAGGKAIIIKEIRVNDENMRPGELLSVKHTFHSPEDQLIKAKLHVPTTLSMNIEEEKYNE